MVNLHYENLPELGRFSPSAMMQRAFWLLREYNDFLAKAEGWLWAPHRMDKVAWEEVESGSAPLSPEKTSPHPERADSHRPMWVRIREIEESDQVDLVDRFCDADSVIEEPTPSALPIRVLDSDNESALLLLERKPEPRNDQRILYARPNTYLLRQQRRSLWRLQNAPDSGHRGLLRLVENSERAFWPRVTPRTVPDWEFLRDLARPGTDQQRRFVQLALGTPDFAFLEGPPGSGKTTTICELILQQIRRGHRVLLCASTHVAVDNVLEVLAARGLTETEVVAVRIGDPRKVSDQARAYQLEEWVKTAKADLTERLAALAKRTESQDYLLQALQTSGDDILARLILDCANLVCGTTIGILQHPEIKANREEAVPKFDLLIVDEASKTTFQEFLVPGLFARRWVLVGDIHQLSPYLETRDVEANVKSVLPEEDAEVCVRTFRTWKSVRDPKPGVAGLMVRGLEKTIRKRYAEQGRALGLAVLDLSTQSAEPAKLPLEILGSHLILSAMDGKGVEPLLPADMVVVPSDPVFEAHARRHAHWMSHFGEDSHGGEASESEEWAKEVAWRLNRVFELRHSPAGAQRYEEEVLALLPKWYHEKRNETVIRDLQLVKRISLPSVLELIQSGFGRSAGGPQGTALTDGMRPQAFAERHVILTYQHRMHPEISRFPREHIYQDQSLRDPEDMGSLLAWPFPRYSARSVWLHVAGHLGPRRNMNADEVEIIMEELEKFLRWASTQPKVSPVSGRQEPWEVAVLAFYRGQEAALRSRLQERFQMPEGRRNFATPDGSVRVVLCTVDRFQGHEADIEFLSFVQTRRVGFLDNPNRLNVALTRARYQLVIVGHREWFRKQRKSDLLRLLAESLPAEIVFVARKEDRPPRAGAWSEAVRQRRRSPQARGRRRGR